MPFFRYFGLQYQDSKGYIAWLKLDKKVGSPPHHSSFITVDNVEELFSLLTALFPLTKWEEQKLNDDIVKPS